MNRGLDMQEAENGHIGQGFALGAILAPIHLCRDIPLNLSVRIVRDEVLLKAMAVVRAADGETVEMYGEAHLLGAGIQSIVG